MDETYLPSATLEDQLMSAAWRLPLPILGARLVAAVPEEMT